MTDVRAARAAMRVVHEKWEAIGHVPRPVRDKVEGRLKRVDDAVRGADESEWRGPTRRRAPAPRQPSRSCRRPSRRWTRRRTAARQAGNADEAGKAEEAAAARREWLTEAEKTLAELS